MWSIREDFVAIFVGQAPMVYPMLKTRFWRGIYKSEGYTGDSDTAHPSYQKKGLQGGKPKDPYSLTAIGLTHIDRSESQEQIVHPNDNSSSGSKGNDDGHVIMVKNTYNVESRSVDGLDQYQHRAF